VLRICRAWPRVDIAHLSACYALPLSQARAHARTRAALPGLAAPAPRRDALRTALESLLIKRACTQNPVPRLLLLVSVQRH
jgi:hypothetical protein